MRQKTMNKIQISDTAKRLAKAQIEPKSRSAWVLDADVQAAVDTLFIEMKGQVPKRRLINALLRDALEGRHVNESAKPQA